MPKAAAASNDNPTSGATDAPTAGEQHVTPGADVAAIATELANSMPEVQEHAVQQAQNEQKAAELNPTDKAGVPFDPAIHATGADGKGTLTSRGTWALKRGRKAGSATNPGTVRNSTLGGPAVPPSAQVVQQQQTEAQARAAGVAAAEMVFMIGQAIGGEEWAPMENKALGMNERDLMHQAFGQYFVATNKTDIPPGAALGFVLIAYAAPRFAMPKTQTRFGKIKAAVTKWWINRKLRRAGLQMQVQDAKDRQGEQSSGG